MTWMISFVKSHPVVGGVLFAIFGVFLIHVSIEGARRYRVFEELKAGDSVALLVSRVNGEVVLASQRPADSPIGLAGFEATPVVFFGIGIALFGIFLAIFGERLLQNA